MPIRILDAATVGRIAAGEVVERPSSVVKELVENSLDAGATAITVEIKGGGIDYLRVTDNGCGIEPGQVRLAFENHATSKLRNADQLNDIRTLGFRGEALPSIASVSHVEMTTRVKNQPSGTRINIDGGENIRVQEVGSPEGTTFIMRDLFFNVPVRRAFLKKPNYEGGLVADAVARLMIGNPGVSMRFINNGNTIYHSYGDGKLRHAVFAVYGKAAAEKMIELDACEGGTRMYGMIGVGELAKSTRAHQLFFINGRAVRCALLSKTLEQVCKSRVTIGMYPMCALNLVLPPNSIDVNVHPNKLEVRFRDEVMTQMTVERLLQSAFEGERILQLSRDTKPDPTVERVATVRRLQPDEIKPAPEKPQMPPLPKPVERVTEVLNAAAESFAGRVEKERARVVLQSAENRIAAVREDERAAVPKGENYSAAAEKSVAHSTAMPLEKTEDNAAGIEKAEGNTAALVVNTVNNREKPVEASVTHQEAASSKPVQMSMAEAVAASTGDAKMPELAPKEEEKVPFRTVGVIFKTYILVETGDTLLLIDQHAAHERIRYELYMKQLEEGRASQQLLTPIVVRLSGREMALIQDNIDLLTEAGYTVEPFGEHDIQIRAVPHVLGKAELKPLFMDMINSLNRLKTAAADARRAEIMQMACKSAVKGGDALSDSEIRALLKEMLETGAPPTCPHGRPVVKTLTKRDLEKMFKRIQ